MNDLSNQLPILQDGIHAAHQVATATARTAIDRARDAGTRLIEAKCLCRNGVETPVSLMNPGMSDGGYSDTSARGTQYATTGLDPALCQ
jgi:hypothetical protein